MFASVNKWFCWCASSYSVNQVHDPTPLSSSETNIENKMSNIICDRQMNVSNSTDCSFLETVKYADTLQYIPNVSFGKVIKVYDADTITIANKISVGDIYSSQIYRFQVRLNGIDTPEIKTKNETTKLRAIKARDALSALIYGKIVLIKNVRLEKYGRLLADVYLDDLHINQWLIDNGHAVEYNGGTKNIPDEWES